jgi:hypothetical protein
MLNLEQGKMHMSGGWCRMAASDFAEESAMTLVISLITLLFTQLVLVSCDNSPPASSAPASLLVTVAQPIQKTITDCV